MKKIFTSFVLTSTLLISNLSAVTSQYLECENKVIENINSKSFIKDNKNEISLMIDVLKKSDEEFNIKVINFLFSNYQDWVKKGDILKIGNNLALLARHIDNKEKVYKEIIKKLKKDRELIVYNKDFIELNKNNIHMKEKIQNLINLTYMGIEAKNTFKSIQILAKMQNAKLYIDDYWYDIDDKEENKALFLISKSAEDFELNKLYEIEDNISKDLQEFAKDKKRFVEPLNNLSFGDYNFNAIKNNFFKRVSFI